MDNAPSPSQPATDAAAAVAAAAADDAETENKRAAAARNWLDTVASPSQPTTDATASAAAAAAADEEKKFAATRKQLLKLLQWDIMDEKHRQLQQIQDTLAHLSRICDNVRDHPDEAKYRRLRISNATFGKHVRDVPGGTEFLLAVGWHAAVHEHEKHYVLDSQPGSFGWRVLEEACRELAKIGAVAVAKAERAKGNRQGELERRREAVRVAMEDDKEERHVKFQYKG